MRLSIRRLAAVSCCALVAACHSPDDRPSGGIVVISAGADAETLFPPLATTNQSLAATGLLYDKLAEIGPALNTLGDAGFEPRLAKSWEWSRDSLRLTLHLDEQARWHDGQPVIARDVQYAFQVWKDSVVGASQRGMLASIDSVVVIDDHTARVFYRARSPEQFYALVYTLVPLPSHLLASIPDTLLAQSPTLRQPVGSGPFRFVAWTPRAKLELAAVPSYYRGRPSVDGVVFVIAAQGATVSARLLAGEADFMEQLAPPDFAQLPRDGAVRTQPYGSLDYAFVQFNLHDPAALAQPHPIFAERALRRALSMAVDRQAIARNVWGDSLAQAAIGPFARSQWTADTTIGGIAYDPRAAARALDSLGWTDTNGDGVRDRGGKPLAFSLLYPASSRSRASAAVILQSQLQQVGVRVTLEQADFNTFVDRARRHDFHALVNAVRTSPSPRGINETWSTPGLERGEKNYGAWSNAGFDAHVDSAFAAHTADDMRDHLHAAYRIAIDDAPAIWLYEPRLFAGHHRRLTTGTLRTDAWWTNVARWSIAPAERLPRDRRAAPAK